MDRQRPVARPDVAKAGGGVLPDFLIIGAAKSGTTSLYHYLNGHPQVWMPHKKEVCFFDTHYARGVDWYRQWFDGAGPGQLVGEASPEYMLHEDAPGRIAQLVPSAKLIAILRNPVDRAHSNYWNYRNQFPDGSTFEEIVRLELGSPKTEPFAPPWPQRRAFLAMGRYLPQLERVTSHFPREALLVLLHDDLRSDPTETLRRACRFLGVDEDAPLHNLDHSYNPSTRLRSEALRRLMLRTHAYRRLPYRVVMKIEQLNRKAKPYPPMDPSLRRELVEWYREDNTALAKWLGRDLSMWTT